MQDYYTRRIGPTSGDARGIFGLPHAPSPRYDITHADISTSQCWSQDFTACSLTWAVAGARGRSSLAVAGGRFGGVGITASLSRI